jgi:hypothetical protein
MQPLNSDLLYAAPKFSAIQRETIKGLVAGERCGGTSRPVHRSRAAATESFGKHRLHWPHRDLRHDQSFHERQWLSSYNRSPQRLGQQFINA